jgi:putative transposase
LTNDAYSPKLVGFYLSKDLAAGGCIRALEMALKNNPVREELIHPSDRGLQYCSYGYVKRLQEHSIASSMTQKGDPLETHWKNYYAIKKGKEVLMV